MPRPALTDEQRRVIRRNIRDAAAKLYTENGANGVSVRAVAEHAGVSVGNGVFVLRKSERADAVTLAATCAGKLVQHMTQLLEEVVNPAEQLSLLLRAYVQFAADEPQVFRSAFLFVRPESVEPPEQVPLAEDNFFSLFSQTISRGQQAGQFRSGDPNTLAQMVLSSVHGALALPINMHRLALSDATSVAQKTIAAQLEWLALDC